MEDADQNLRPSLHHTSTPIQRSVESPRFITYAITKAFSGRGREISWLAYTLAFVLIMYFVFVRSRMG